MVPGASQDLTAILVHAVKSNITFLLTLSLSRCDSNLATFSLNIRYVLFKACQVLPCYILEIGTGPVHTPTPYVYPATYGGGGGGGGKQCNIM